jgi:hypothetical protein
MTTEAYSAIVRKRCILNGIDYNAGEYIKNEEFEKISPQRANSLFFCNILMDITPQISINTDSVYEARINLTLKGEKYVGGQVINNELLRTMTPYAFQALINNKYIAKVSNASYKSYEKISFRLAKQTATPKVVGKECTKCNEVKPMIDFYRENRTRGRSRSFCKSCYKIDVTKNRKKKSSED